MEDSKSHLTQAFIKTNYVILCDPKIVLNINQSFSSLVDRFPHLYSWAFLTAWNPLPLVLTHQLNLNRNNELKIILETNGYKFHQGIGISETADWSEDSFFIENITKAKAHELASAFGQMAFLFGDLQLGNQLIFTNNQ